MIGTTCDSCNMLFERNDIWRSSCTWKWSIKIPEYLSSMFLPEDLSSWSWVKGLHIFKMRILSSLNPKFHIPTNRTWFNKGLICSKVVKFDIFSQKSICSWYYHASWLIIVIISSSISIWFTNNQSILKNYTFSWIIGFMALKSSQLTVSYHDIFE